MMSRVREGTISLRLPGTEDGRYNETRCELRWVCDQTGDVLHRMDERGHVGETTGEPTSGMFDKLVETLTLELVDMSDEDVPGDRQHEAAARFEPEALARFDLANLRKTKTALDPEAMTSAAQRKRQ